MFVNDGTNVFREVDNGVPMKYASIRGRVQMCSAALWNYRVPSRLVRLPPSRTRWYHPNRHQELHRQTYCRFHRHDEWGFHRHGGLNALTIALTTMAGTDPTASDVVSIPFRAGTATNSVINVRSVSSALSVVVSAGSTLGFSASQISRIYVVALDNAGTVELVCITPLGTTLIPLNESQFFCSTTAEGGAGARTAHR